MWGGGGGWVRVERWRGVPIEGDGPGTRRRVAKPAARAAARRWGGSTTWRVRGRGASLRRFDCTSGETATRASVWRRWARVRVRGCVQERGGGRPVRRSTLPTARPQKPRAAAGPESATSATMDGHSVRSPHHVAELPASATASIALTEGGGMMVSHRPPPLSCPRTPPAQPPAAERKGGDATGLRLVYLRSRRLRLGGHRPRGGGQLRSRQKLEHQKLELLKKYFVPSTEHLLVRPRDAMNGQVCPFGLPCRSRWTILFRFLETRNLEM